MIAPNPHRECFMISVCNQYLWGTLHFLPPHAWVELVPELEKVNFKINTMNVLS